MVCKAVIEQLEIVMIEIEYAEADLETRRREEGRSAPDALDVHLVRLRAANQAVHLAIEALAALPTAQHALAPPPL